MASQAIKNLKNLVIDGAIATARERIEEEAMKKILEIREKIPTKEDIKMMILEAIIKGACEPAAQEKLKSIYDQLQNLINNVIIDPLQGGIEAVDSIYTEMKKIKEDVLDKIKEILDFLNPIIIAMRIIIQVAPATLAASSGPAASGLVIDKTGRAIDKGFMYAAAYSEIILSMIEMISRTTEKILKIVDIVQIALNQMNMVLAQVKAIQTYLEFLFLQFLSQCNVNNQNATDNQGLVNTALSVENVLNNNDLGTIEGSFEDVQKKMNELYQNLLEDLKKEGKTELIEILKNESFGFNVEYRVITVPTL
tara:strand:+ start:234 stop:1160 length:927 start_codon:yes stop_codon:yes gene_type:complete